MASPEKTIAFIGLGVMGYSMAVNLRSKMPSDYTIVACDVSSAVIDRYQTEMKGKGPIKVVKTGAEAAHVADTVITMLPDGKAVKAVYLDPEVGILAGAKSTRGRPKMVVECGTIETATILEVGNALKNANINVTFVDAPVSGGPMGAEAGTLAFMVGSSDEDFPTVKKLLATMGKEEKIFHCGNVSSGTAFKVVHNYLSAIISLAASEALNIGAKAGLDIKKLTDVINAGGAQNWIVQYSNPVPGIQPNVPSSRNYEGGFRIELCKKVLAMGMALAKDSGAKTVLDKPTLAALEEAAADPRYAGKDARIVYMWLNEAKME